MTAAEVVADPIGQLNLMLWMTQPLPGECPVRPVLKEAGYRLMAIGPAMPLLPDLRERLQVKGLACRVEPEPDLLLTRDDGQEYLMLECKRTMFGADSSTAEQARGLVLQTGEQFNTVVGLPVAAATTAGLVYVSEHCDSPNPADGLNQIREELEGAGFPVAPAGVTCLQARDDGIYLIDEYQPGTIPEPLYGIVRAGIKVQEIVEGEEAMPLLLIPWDPNVSQTSPVAQFGKQVFCHRLLGSLVVRIGKLVPGQEFEVEYDDLLDEATFNFYQRWRTRNTEIGRTLRGFCRTIIQEALKDVPDLQAEPLAQGRVGRRITVGSESAKEATIDAITKYARKACPEIASPAQQALPLDAEEM